MSHGLVSPTFNRLSITRSAGCLAALLVLCQPLASSADEAAPEPSAEHIAFFESKIRPILVENCYKCHGSEKQQGELRLDSRASFMHGGESGPTIVPGKPDESLLIEAVKYESFEMPPSGRLKTAEIDALSEWIKIGAPFPKEHGGGGPALRQNREKITDEDRAWWAFQPLRSVAPPAVPGDNWSRNQVDSFLLAAMQAEGLQPAPEADRATLIRRLTFDLTGLPPTPDEIDAFVANNQPDAYEQLVERLLASPQYGQRWGRHWLDLVRYAESDGYRQDAYRPLAWRYRDYVVRAFNTDKPYTQFMREQLAGDEIVGGDADALVATGYLRQGIYEYNQRDIKGQWSVILNDITDVTSDVFLGMGMGCARCHDHKFDPILQKDYFRLQAFFTPLLPREETPALGFAELAEYQAKLRAWEEKTADIRAELDELTRPALEAATKGQLVRFPDDCQEFLFKPTGERAPYEEQLYQLAYRQAIIEQEKIDFKKKLTGEKLERYQQLQTELAKFDSQKPQAPLAMTVSDIGPQAPPTLIPGKPRLGEIEPGVLSVLDPNPLQIPTPSQSNTTGRRTALAEWLASDANPLTPRVMVNRIWQHHFGRGLVESPSDFGRLGQPPSHPELFDWLATEFVDSGWRLKHMHRLMVTSAAYRQSSRGAEIVKSAEQDPSNRWLSRMTVQRLQAEQIRDASLAATGELRLSLGGEGMEASEPKRTVYVKVLRNKRDPLLDVFDAPDAVTSMPIRNVTTTPTQALMMINGPWMQSRAKALATRINQASPTSDEERVRQAYRAVLGRAPTDDQQRVAIEFLAAGEGKPAERLIDFCHVLLNSNEFLYLD